MAVISRVSIDKDTTNDWVLVTETIIQTTYGTGLSYTIYNSGEDDGEWQLVGGNMSDFSDATDVVAAETVVGGGAKTYSSAYAPFEFYGVYVHSLVADTPTTLKIRGILKN